MNNQLNYSDQGLKLIMSLLSDLHDSGEPPHLVHAEDGILTINRFQFSIQQSKYLVQNSEPLQCWLAEAKPECLLV